MNDFKDKAIQGDSLETLNKMEENSLDFCVTDSPYGISFMGRSWDYDVPKVEMWEALLRVLKPGAHALIFGGTTTFHRLLVNVEDAGFQVRNIIPWLYGEGFPKNLDVGKAIDKAAGAERDVIRERKDRVGNTEKSIHKDNGFATARTKEFNETAPATEDAKQWDGYGTALKPATELIALVRKPLSEKTVAANVLRWGTGALNINGSRIAHGDEVDMDMKQRTTNLSKEKFHDQETRNLDTPIQTYKPGGRWPSNIIFDQFAALELDRQSGHSRSSDTPRTNSPDKAQVYGEYKKHTGEKMHDDSGGASRFFKIIDPDSDGLFTYQAKASKAEKNAGCENLEQIKTNDGREKDADNAYQRGSTLRGNSHPTVKPLALIKYLVNLVAFPGAWGIDIYAGSGTFAIACRELFLHWTCLERDENYFKIIESRLRQGYLIDTMGDK